MRIRHVAAVLAVAGQLGACSSAPRTFNPRLAAAPADEAAFRQTYEDCSAQVKSGQRSNFAKSRGASAGVGTAVGVGAGLATGASAASGAGMLAGAAGAAGLAVGFVFVAPVAIWGTSRAIRAHNEKVVKAALSACLTENGYEVADWELARKTPAPRAAT